MRTLTALALATALLFTVASANATTKKHHTKKHKTSHSQKSSKDAKAPKADSDKAAPAK